MRRVAVGQSGIHALLVIGVKGVPKMEEKGCHLALLRRREASNAALDVFNAHGRQNTACSMEDKCRESTTCLALRRSRV